MHRRNSYFSLFSPSTFRNSEEGALPPKILRRRSFRAVRPSRLGIREKCAACTRGCGSLRGASGPRGDKLHAGVRARSRGAAVHPAKAIALGIMRSR